MGDIGNGDDQAKAALVVGCVVGFGKDGIVEVARVFVVDGDQGGGAQILAPRRGSGTGGVG